MGWGFAPLEMYCAFYLFDFVENGMHHYLADLEDGAGKSLNTETPGLMW